MERILELLSAERVWQKKSLRRILIKKEDTGEFNNFNSFGMYKLYLIGRPIPTLNYTFVF